MRRWLTINLSMLTGIILMIGIHPVAAAGPIAALELQDVSFNGCVGDIFSGSFRIVAYDTDGLVANATTPVDTIRTYATSYNVITLQQDSTSNQVQDFLIDFNGASILYGTLTVSLVSDPGIQAPTYRFDCVTGEVIIIDNGGQDDRINPGMGDLIDVLYARHDTAGQSVIHVYTVESDGKGRLVGYFPNSDFTAYLSNPPEEVVEIDTIDYATLYALPTGEFQINIGPDIEGKVTSVIFSGLPPVSVHKREFNIYKFGQ
jgi:hypothetical protein